MNELVPIENSGKAVRLYEKMQMTIAECHSLDDCKAIAEEAAAIAAYHKQIKDDASVRKFLQIKLRAWRRIGELLSKVARSGCEGNVAAYIRRIRDAFSGNKAVEEMSESSIREALRVASLPADFFEREVGDHKTIYSIMFAYETLQQKIWEATPEGLAELKGRAQRDARWRAEEAAKQTAAKAAAEEADQREIEERHLAVALKAARDEALCEVGVTLERRDRERMREVMFLIKDTVHEALRQSAFEHQMTMQAILRAGLALWFIAHGYDVPMSEMDLRPMKKK